MPPPLEIEKLESNQGVKKKGIVFGFGVTESRIMVSMVSWNHGDIESGIMVSSFGIVDYGIINSWFLLTSLFLDSEKKRNREYVWFFRSWNWIIFCCRRNQPKSWENFSELNCHNCTGWIGNSRRWQKSKLLLWKWIEET